MIAKGRRNFGRLASRWKEIF